MRQPRLRLNPRPFTLPAFRDFEAVFTVLVLGILAGYILLSLLVDAGRKRSASRQTDLVALETVRWNARQGFSPTDAAGFDPSAPGVRSVDRLPLYLNQLFETPVGSGLHEYTVQCEFSAPAGMEKRATMLLLAEVGENWAVYLNGVEIRSEIYLDARGQIAVQRSVQRALIPIPTGLLRAGQNRLVLRILGITPPIPVFQGLMPGLPMGEGYRIAPAEDLILQRDVRSMLSWFQIGVYTFFAFYYFLLFWRRREGYAMLLGVFLVIAASYSVFNSTHLFTWILDTAIITRMLYASNVLMIGVVGLSVWWYIYEVPPTRGLRLLALGHLAVGLFMLCMPFGWVGAAMRLFLPAILASIIYLILMIRRAARAGNYAARVILLAGGSVMVFVILGFLDVLVLRSGMDLASWAPFILAISFAFVFINRFWRMAENLGEANRLLAQSRDRLEENVALQTEELRSANTLLGQRLAEINQLQESLKEQAFRDPLTGVYNRWLLIETLEREFARARREGHEVCLVMLDCDHFKRLNDAHGHRAGDQVLRKVGELLLSTSRRGDFPCRYGGEEFLAVLPLATLSDGQARAEKWRQSIEEEQVEMGVTVSVGVACFPTHGETPDAVLDQVDKALYQAKERGRNRVEVAPTRS